MRTAPGPNDDSEPHGDGDLAFSISAHSPSLRRLAAALVSDAAAADDLVQETWVLRMRKAPPSSVDEAAWLAGVLRNLAWRRNRGRARKVRRELEAARSERDAGVGEGMEVERRSVREHLAAAVRALGSPVSEVIRQHYLEELPLREVARRLDRPLGTVKSQLHRGLAQLELSLEEEYGDRRAWSLALIAAFPWDRKDVAAVGSAASALGISIALAFSGAVLALAATLFVWGGSPESSPSGLPGGLDRDPLAVTPVAGVDPPASTRVEPAVEAENAQAKASDSPPGEEPSEASAESSDPAVALPRVEVFVRDHEGHRVRNATVDLHGPAGVRELGTTGADGTLIITLTSADLAPSGVNLGQDTLVLSARAPGQVISRRKHTTWNGGGERIVLALRGPELVVRGQVTDAVGDPLPGVTIDTSSDATRLGVAGHEQGFYSSEPLVSAESGADGRFELVNLSRNTVCLHASKPGMAGITTIIAADGRSQVETLIVMRRGATIRGVVTQESGSPVAGASVRIGGDKPLPSDRVTSTDQQGRYELTNVICGLVSRLIVRGPDGGAAVVMVFAEDGETLERDMVLSEIVPMRAQVVDELGKPLTEACVIFTFFGFPIGTKGTQERAWDEKVVPDAGGLVELYRRHPGRPVYAYVWATHDQNFPVGTTVWEKADPEIRTIVCTVEPHLWGEFSGRIVDPGRSLGPGTKLRVHQRSTKAPFYPGLDEDGSFELDRVPPGTYDLVVTTQSRGIATLDSVVIAPGALVELGDMEIPRCGTLSVDWTSEWHPADVQHHLVIMSDTPTILQVDRSVILGSGHLEGSIELLPGLYVLAAFTGGKLAQTRYFNMRDEHDLRIEIGPGVPYVVTVDAHGSETAESAEFLLYDLGQEFPELADGRLEPDQCDSIHAALQPTETRRRDPSRPGVFRGEVLVQPGRWAILVYATDGTCAGTVVELESGTVHRSIHLAGD